jgi:ribulose-phosphate 3-epimerase
MKISASIYSAKAASLPALLKELDNHGVNLLHVDCNDDPKVFADIEQINQLSNTPVDLHIISSTPEKYFEAIAAANPLQVSFQYENFPAPIDFPKNRNYKIGLAITSATNIDVFESYQAQCDYILLMTTTPGQSGGTFDKNTFLRIREFQKRFPKIPVQVDGGVLSLIHI